jgi:hypothetical protein
MFEVFEVCARFSERDGDGITGSRKGRELDTVTRELRDVVDALSLGSPESFRGE